MDTDYDKDKATYEGDFGAYPSEVNWDHSPLAMQRMTFTKKQKIMIQITITTVLLLALYFAYRSVEPILNATPTSGLSMPSDTKISGWFQIAIPLLAIVPGVYTFMFLKYNFNKKGILLREKKK